MPGFIELREKKDVRPHTWTVNIDQIVMLRTLEEAPGTEVFLTSGEQLNASETKDEIVTLLRGVGGTFGGAGRITYQGR